MFIHNYIKILYSGLGYLPSTPYHLISDREMFEAFLKEDGILADYYPCPSSELETEYDALVECIKTMIDENLSTGRELPDWIYSYMTLNATSVNSDESDIAYLCNMLEIEDKQSLAEFTPQLAEYCYEVSKRWLAKDPSVYADRVPTMFGEPHVIKSLRLIIANIFDS